MSLSDADFLRAFIDCTLPREHWTHEAHIRMAWLILEQDPFTVALAKICTGIQRYNTSVNSLGYHTTVTVAFSQLIQHRRLTGRTKLLWREFIAANSDLLSKQPPILSHFYSPELLASEAAKRAYIAPDLVPLPSLAGPMPGFAE